MKYFSFGDWFWVNKEIFRITIPISVSWQLEFYRDKRSRYPGLNITLFFQRTMYHKRLLGYLYDRNEKN